ncbi:MAG TPA: SPOR domain-containing protein [Thermoanaerobaculia bacterium]|nr:SPOR domain-containing protein [Thermoanaerobaculia bacterium]
MSEEAVHQQHHHTDDQSHYEISLTAGQAFVAFVLLLLSLAASFAFGLMIGKGQADERLVVRKEPAVVTEASVLPKKTENGGKIVELGVADDDFQPTETAATTSSATPAVADEAASEVATASVVPAEPTPLTQAQIPATVPVTATATAGEAPAAPTVAPAAKPVATPAAAAPVYAQLLSTLDQKTAEALAVKLINGGFTSAYVVRGNSDKGAIFRVRVRFSSETEARAAEPKLKAYSNDVWITR